MTKNVNAEIETRLHPDGAVSHHITHANGTKQVVLVKTGHALAQQFIAHGSKAKIQAAINSATDKVPATDKVDLLDHAWDEGRWTMQEGSGKAKGTLLGRALAQLKGIELDAAEAYVKTLTKAQQAAMRADPRVAPIIADLRAADHKDEGNDALDAFLGGVEVEQAAA